MAGLRVCDSARLEWFCRYCGAFAQSGGGSAGAPPSPRLPLRRHLHSPLPPAGPPCSGAGNEDRTSKNAMKINGYLVSRGHAARCAARRAAKQPMR
jgi:hypothetical protein